jgi:hypothetical protein
LTGLPFEGSTIMRYYNVSLFVYVKTCNKN